MHQLTLPLGNADLSEPVEPDPNDKPIILEG